MQCAQNLRNPARARRAGAMRWMFHTAKLGEILFSTWPWDYGGYILRSEIEAPLITREVLPETYFLLVIMAADAQAGPFLQFQASCSCGTL